MGCRESKVIDVPIDLPHTKPNGNIYERIVIDTEDGDITVRANENGAAVRVADIVDAVNRTEIQDADIIFSGKGGRRGSERNEDTVQTVKVEVHSSSPASDENMCYSDMSERSADNDYEDIYQVREEVANHKNNIANNNNNVTINNSNNKINVRRRSRDSGSHSRSTSISSTGSHVVQVHHATLAVSAGNSEDHSSLTMTQSTAESGVSSATPSDLGGSEEETESKAKVSLSQRRSLPHPLPDSRALKRVSSEPGFLCPPPPPPPPQDDAPPPPPPAQSRTLPNTPTTPRTPVSLSTLPAYPRQEVYEATQDGVSRENAGAEESEPEEGKSVSGLVNRQKVLPFIPPKFNASSGSDSLIKPSEYLKSLGPTKPPLLASLEATLQNQSGVKPSSVILRESAPSSDVTEAATNHAPPPPPLPEMNPSMDVCQHPTSQGESNKSESTKAQQPLGAISVHDLNSVQLRRTDKMLASKTLSAPPTTGHHSVIRTQPPHKPDQPYLAQKTDLIAELKMSKDITGIKKMKVERAKVEERQEKELFSEITKQLTVDSFVEKQIPEQDNTGNPIPPWKRQMLAKKAADRARKELEEQKKKEAEEKRLKAIPAWKRQLLAKKDEVDPKKVPVYTPRVVEEKRVVKPLSNGTTVIAVNGDSNKENTTPAPVTSQVVKEVAPATPSVIVTPSKQDEDPTPVMPWRSQLRKTNSKLNLLE